MKKTIRSKKTIKSKNIISILKKKNSKLKSKSINIR